MSKFGGGGTKCAACDKTAYPAETVTFEKIPYHADCFRCSLDQKKLTPGGAAMYEGVIFCRHCFDKEGYAQKQRSVKWVAKEGGSGDAPASKFGGGGNPCKICAKTVYAAETLSFEKEVYHPACFKCTVCEKKITASQASSFEDAIICRKCFAENGYTQKQTAKAKQGWVAKETSAASSKFGGGGTVCAICEKTVYAAETMPFEKMAYHAGCFKCGECDKKMTPSDANKYDLDEADGGGRKLLCKKCFTDGGWRQKQAAQKKGTSASADPRFAKFGGGGATCVRCEKSVFPAEQVSVNGQIYHGECLTCLKCEKKLTPSTSEFHKGPPPTIHCKSCFQEQGLHRADR